MADEQAKQSYGPQYRLTAQHYFEEYGLLEPGTLVGAGTSYSLAYRDPRTQKVLQRPPTPFMEPMNDAAKKEFGNYTGTTDPLENLPLTLREPLVPPASDLPLTTETPVPPEADQPNPTPDRTTLPAPPDQNKDSFPKDKK